MSSAAADLQVALVDAMVGDSVLAALLSGDKVYSLRVPETTPPVPRPYIVLGSSLEIPNEAFGRHGVSNDETGHIWGAKQDKMEVLGIYRELARVLRAPLTVGGFEAYLPSIRLVTVLSDPDDGLAHLVFQYTVRHRG